MADGSARFAQTVDVPKGLTYCSDEMPGLTRKASGKGFQYLDRDGKPVKDKATLDRVRALAIPPAWTDVWICTRPTGHIQATGRDAKGRKQYRYHNDWTEHRSTGKFDRLTDFARALPRLRKRVEADLSTKGFSRDKVLATVVSLLEMTLIRVGNREYARKNRSYGLTTLNKRHVQTTGGSLAFSFRGKSGVDHKLTLKDRRLARIVRSLRELPGQALFKYQGEDGELCELTSDDVNAYIRDAMGPQFSAKDFRTWAGTVSAARALRSEDAPTSATAGKRTVNTCVKAVAGLLGNTPTVCRSSYIHPRVFELYENGEIEKALPGPDAKTFESSLIKVLAA